MDTQWSKGANVREGAMTTTTTPRRPPTRAQLRTRSMSRLKRARHVVQVLIAGAVLFAAVRHQVEKGAGAASVDALCPFGAVETLPTLLTSGSVNASASHCPSSLSRASSIQASGSWNDTTHAGVI